MPDKYFTRLLPVGFSEIRKMYRDELGTTSFTKRELSDIRSRILERIVRQRRKKYFRSFVILSIILVILAVIMYFFLVNWGHSVAV